jgi:deoxyuridine 5'-triphosphate nucleotidohydrolase
MSNDEQLLKDIKDLICPDISLKNKLNGLNKLKSLTFNSQQMVKDVCKWLNITPGKKSDKVCFPDLNSNFLKWAFIRGYFDGDGSINQTINSRYPKCDIASNSQKMRNSIVEFIKIPCSNSDKNNRIYFSHNNALDFLNKLYENSKISLQRKKELYLDWSVWVPSLSGTGNHGEDFIFKWNKTRKDAIPPSKNQASDSGFDLVLLEKVKSFGEVEFYDTGIKIQPAYGWYFDLVPRSSITKSGYMLANSIGIIDRSYIGNILVPLIKIDKQMPDLVLPNRLVQLIPRPIIHIAWTEVDVLDETERGTGGFGSTGKN